MSSTFIDESLKTVLVAVVHFAIMMDIPMLPFSSKIYSFGVRQEDSNGIVRPS
jgi:hypothetical protein